MEKQWILMKDSIALANKINEDASKVEAFHGKLKRAIDSVVTDCRTERKIARSKESAVDLSDSSMQNAAQFTDNLPLANYDGILHLVPRLVNIVTVRLFNGTTHLHTHNLVTLWCVCVSAVGRSHSRCWKRPQVAAQLARDWREMQQRLLCAQTLRGRSIGIFESSLPRSRLS